MLSKLIIDYLQERYPQTVHKGELGKKCILDWGYEAETLGRECRRLEVAGKIKVEYNEKHHAMYKYIPQSDNQVVQKFLEDFPAIPKQEAKNLQEQFDKLTLF